MSRSPAPLAAPLFLSLLATGVIGAGCVPTAGNAASAAGAAAEKARLEAWGRKAGKALSRYNATLASDEAYFRREQARLIREKKADELMGLMVGYARQTQRISVQTMHEGDAAGEPPREARRMMELLRRLMKMRANSGRSMAHALATGDFDRFDRLVAREAKEMPPLQRALEEEVLRVVPGATAPRRPTDVAADTTGSGARS